MTLIYLIRHGEYNYRDVAPATVGQGLTARGKQQAEATARWLAASDGGIRSVRSSDFSRAAETASILVNAFPLASLELDPQLRECDDVYFRDAVRVPGSVTQTFDRLFGPAVNHLHPLAVVCHANLIRYLLCRLLAWTRPEWESVLIGNCSVSIVELRSGPQTEHRVIAVGNVQHMPAELRDTY